MSKTLKLDDLLNEITPLPWEAPTGIIGRIANSREQVKANRAYEAHAANELPKLVKALGICIAALQSAPCGCDTDFTCHSHQAINSASEALQSATQITIE